MSNQLEKLKNSIKTEYVKQFELNLMKTSGFIPVDRRQNNFYVIINKKNADYEIIGYALSNIEEIKKIEELKPDVVITDIYRGQFNKKNAGEKDSISTAIQEKLGDLVPQFIPLDSSDFDEVFKIIDTSSQEIVLNDTVTERTVDVGDDKKELSAEDMLVGIGWLTDSQLKEAMRTSVERNITRLILFWIIQCTRS